MTAVGWNFAKSGGSVASLSMSLTMLVMKKLYNFKSQHYILPAYDILCLYAISLFQFLNKFSASHEWVKIKTSAISLMLAYFAFFVTFILRTYFVNFVTMIRLFHNSSLYFIFYFQHIHSDNNILTTVEQCGDPASRKQEIPDIYFIPGMFPVLIIHQVFFLVLSFFILNNNLKAGIHHPKFI